MTFHLFIVGILRLFLCFVLYRLRNFHSVPCFVTSAVTGHEDSPYRLRHLMSGRSIRRTKRRGLHHVPQTTQNFAAHLITFEKCLKKSGIPIYAAITEVLVIRPEDHKNVQDECLCWFSWTPGCRMSEPVRRVPAVSERKTYKTVRSVQVRRAYNQNWDKRNLRFYWSFHNQILRNLINFSEISKPYLSIYFITPQFSDNKF